MLDGEMKKIKRFFKPWSISITKSFLEAEFKIFNRAFIVNLKNPILIKNRV